MPASTSALTATPWSGTWETGTFGIMTLTQNGSTVTGTYTYDEGQLTGTVAGNTLAGTWTEAPTRQGSDAGPFIFTLAPDGRSWTGMWAHTGQAPTRTDWNGTCTGGGCLTPGPVPPTTRGQPPIVGTPLYRIVEILGRPEARMAADASDRRLQTGWVLGAGDRITVPNALNINGESRLRIQKLSDGTIYDVVGNSLLEYPSNRAFPAIVDLTPNDVHIISGRVIMRTDGATSPLELLQRGVLGLLTPVAGVAGGGGVVRVDHNPDRKTTTVANLSGKVRVMPSNPRLRPVQLAPGRQVRVTPSSIGEPTPVVSDPASVNLATTIPSPRIIRAGPARVTAPSTVSLRALLRSKCIRTAVVSARPARVLVTIFSGRRSVRLFGQRLVTFTAPGSRVTCIRVPARAKTFNVRTPLRFAVGYALGARARAGAQPRPPVIRPIRLVP